MYIKKILSGALFAVASTSALAETELKTTFVNAPFVQLADQVSAKLALASQIGPERAGMVAVASLRDGNSFADQNLSHVWHYKAANHGFYSDKDWLTTELKPRSYLDTVVYDKVNLDLLLRTASTDLGVVRNSEFQAFAAFVDVKDMVQEFVMMANLTTDSAASQDQPPSPTARKLFSFEAGNQFARSGSCVHSMLVKSGSIFGDGSGRFCTEENQSRAYMDKAVYATGKYVLKYRLPSVDIGLVKENSVYHSLVVFYTPSGFVRQMVMFQNWLQAS